MKFICRGFWVIGSNNDKKIIEGKFIGVHEFKPHVRGECYTEKFTFGHPESIINNMDELINKFNNQLNLYQ